MKRTKSKRAVRRSVSGRLSLGTYMACAATVGGYGLASSAEASIVVLNLANVGTNSKNITGPNANLAPGAQVQVDNFPSVVGTPELDLYNLYVPVSGIIQTGLDGDSGLSIAISAIAKASPRAFSTGATIDGTSGILWSQGAQDTAFYLNYYTSVYSSPDFGANKYLAFRVDAGGGNYQYGWIEATWNSTTKVFQLLSAAYETSYNTAITAGNTGGGGGAVPEPSSGVAVAMLMGGTALRQWRKNRREAATNAGDGLAS